MGRLYAVPFENISILNADGDQDLFYIAPADDKPCKVHALHIAQISDVGDAAEEMLRFKVIRGHATVGSGGAAVTPTPLNPSDTAAAFTARRNDTTIASIGTPVDLHADAFNIRTGIVIVLTPECRWVVTQGQTTLVVRLMAGPADDLTMSGTLYVEEEG